MKMTKNLLSGIASRVSQRVPSVFRQVYVSFLFVPRHKQYDSCWHERSRSVHKRYFRNEPPDGWQGGRSCVLGHCKSVTAKVRIRPDGHSTKVFIEFPWYRHGHYKYNLCWQRRSVGTTRTQPNGQANNGLSRVFDNYSGLYVKNWRVRYWKLSENQIVSTLH